MVCHLPLKNGEKTDDEACYRIVLLACGHLIGQECMWTFATQPGYQFQCPQCRTELAHQQCGHQAQGIFVDDFLMVKNLLRAKLVGGTEDGMVPPLCRAYGMVPTISHLANLLYERVTLRERLCIGRDLIFHTIDPWDGTINYRTRWSPGKGQRFRARLDENNVLVWPWDEEIDYSTPAFIHHQLLNAKTRPTMHNARARELRAWAPSWVNIYVGLPHGDKFDEDAVAALDRVVARLPDINESPDDPFI